MRWISLDVTFGQRRLPLEIAENYLGRFWSVEFLPDNAMSPCGKRLVGRLNSGTGREVRREVGCRRVEVLLAKPLRGFKPEASHRRTRHLGHLRQGMSQFVADLPIYISAISHRVAPRLNREHFGLAQ